MKAGKEDLRKSLLLYAVTDRSWLEPGECLKDAVEKALKGGATFIQIREKELDAESFEREARELKALCARYHVPFVVNDDVMLAKRIGCDGVHVGQDDMEAGSVRELLGPDMIIGVSCSSVFEALRAQECGADYLGVGAVFPTSSKDDADPVSKETVRAICEAVTIPVIAIGGITAQNVRELAGCGLDGIAVISAIFGQKDICGAARELKNRAEEIVRR